MPAALARHNAQNLPLRSISSALLCTFLWQIRQNRHRKIILRMFSRLTAVVVLVLAVSSSSRAQQPDSGRSIYLTDSRSVDAQPLNADGLLRLAAERLESQPTVKAKLRQRVDLFGYNLVGSGMY